MFDLFCLHAPFCLYKQLNNVTLTESQTNKQIKSRFLYGFGEGGGGVVKDFFIETYLTFWCSFCFIILEKNTPIPNATRGINQSTIKKLRTPSIQIHIVLFEILDSKLEESYSLNINLVSVFIECLIPLTKNKPKEKTS